MDTGAAISVIDRELCHRLRKVQTPYVGPVLCGANENRIYPIGQCTVRVLIDGIRHHIQLAVLSSCAHPIILGWDFLSAASAVISCGPPVIRITDTENSSAYDFSSPHLVAAADFVLPPAQERILTIRSSDTIDGDAVVVPDQRCIFRGIAIACCLVRFSRGHASLTAYNTTTEPQLLPEGSTVASLIDIAPVCVVTVSSPPSVAKCTPPGGSSNALKATLSPYLTPTQTNDLMALLTKHKTCFDVCSDGLGQTTVTSHHIATDGSRIIRRRPYRVSSSERKVIEEQVNDMLARNVIRPSTSPWSSPVVLVKKRDGSVRFCVDYRALNKITRKDVYPMPRIDDALDTLQGAEYFSSLDLRSGYWQIPMHESDKEKTAFATPDGLFEFNVMPFGLCNAPATFERMIDTVLRGLKWKTCLCYLDDIVIFSSSFSQHLERLDEVLTCLAKAGLQLNTKKCRFASRSIKVLGHVVSKLGIEPDPDKVAAVLHFPRPTALKDLRSFLGLASYFRRFVRDFATIAAPLHKLLTTSASFLWTDDCEAAFQTLKRCLTSGPVLRHFDPTAPTILHTDASGHGIGAVLLQRDQASQEQVVAYASRTLSPAERNYSITEQECLAIVWSVQKFRPYLYGRRFTIVTDHHALCWLSSLKNLSGRLGRWVLRLQEYDYSVTYRSGRKHQDADALSRCPLLQNHDASTCCAAPPSQETTQMTSLSPIEPTAPDDFLQSADLTSLQRADTYCRTIIDRLTGSSRAPNSRLRRQLTRFKLHDGTLLRQTYHPLGSRWVPVIPRSLRLQVLEAFHDDPTAGHLGFHKTYDRIKTRCFWPGLSTSVSRYVTSCSSCQHRKRSTSLPAGPLQPLPCPSEIGRAHV